MKTYIVSFGNSGKYKVELCCSKSGAFKCLKDEILSFLKEKFPLLEAARFYDKITVTEVTPENEGEYRDYPYLTDKAVEEIKSTLATEVETEQALKSLDANARFSDIN